MGSKRPTRYFHRKKRAALYALGASVLSLAFFRYGPLHDVDQFSRDIVFYLRSAPAPPSAVLVAAVDEKSVKRYGRWPWSRSLQARLIQRLKSMGAGIIALDIIYLRSESAEADRTLARVIAEPETPVVGGYFFRAEQSVGTDAERLDLLREERIRLINERPASRRDTVTAFPFVETSQPELMRAMSAMGFFNTLPDGDGLVRSLPLVLGFQGTLYPSLALQALARYVEAPIRLAFSAEGLGGIYLGTNEIPVDSAGLLILNFYSRERAIPLLSAADILDGALQPDEIRGRLVFLGVTEIGIADVQPTPVSQSFPGVLVHATAAANILQGFYLYQDNRVLLIDVTLVGLAPLIIVWLLTQGRKPLYLLALFPTTLSLVLGLSVWLIAGRGLLVSIVYPLASVLIAYGVFLAYYVLTSQRKTRFLTRAFSSYISPHLVDRLLDEPDKLSLGGERREITMLFSDVRSFTTISESMNPEALVAMLNAYLGAMTDVVLSQEGTLDKYIGDAVMAVFNAPLDIPDHPARAAGAALSMLATLDRLNERFAQEYGQRLRIGIGIHTGEAIVGNLGSQRRFDYTAIGDTVNLSSRLEGATKLYGVPILMSAATRQRLGEQFMCRRIDRIRVKGKQEVAEIYELMRHPGDPRQRELAGRFEQALEPYLAGDFGVALQRLEALARDFPDDRPTRLFGERCRQYIDHAPEHWEGIYVAEAK